MRTLGPKTIGRWGATFGLTALGLAALLLGFAWLARPNLSDAGPAYSPQALAEAEALRDISFDPEDPMRVQVEVDYAAGEAAAWWPRGESPLLAELVERGALPPVAERVGPEPNVMQGVDGVGEYGGTWLRLNGLLMNNRMTYTTLARFSPQGFPIVPHLARGWEVNDDATRWTFILRRGVRWSDGHPFTAEDIAYWWDHEVNSDAFGGGAPPDFMSVNGEPCRVITDPDDPYRVTFEFPAPKGNFLALIASSRGSWMTNSPAHYLRPYHPELGDPELIDKAMSAAKIANPRTLYFHMKALNNPHHPRMWPWIIRTYKANPPETAVRNPYYWCVDAAGNQLPYIDRVLSEQVSQDMVALRAAGGGVSLQSRYLSFGDYTYLMDQREAGGYELYHWYAGDRSWFAIQPNLNRRTDPAHPQWAKKRALMRDKRFRQAMSLAIDREAIIEAVYNGQAEPAQVAPGRESPFFHEKLYTAFTDHDPARAKALLDAIGLTQYDSEGYRTHLDGSRMTFYFDYTTGLVSARPVQFVVDDWAAVGVRVIARERQRGLWSVEREGLLHDFNVWIGNCEHYPIIEPRFFAPVSNSYFALAYARWNNRGGMRGDPDAVGPGREALEPGEPLYRALEAYLDACRTPVLEEQVRRFKPALDIAAEHVWSIGICSTPPALVVVNDAMGNVPDTAIYTWEFQSPANAGIETFYLSPSNNPPSAVEQIRQEIQAPTGRPGDAAIEAARAAGQSQASGPSPVGGTFNGAQAAPARPRPSPSSPTTASLLTTLIWVAVGIAVLLVAVRHPYIGRRLLIMIPTMAIISVIVFTVIQLPPGDYLTSLMLQLQESGDEVAQQRVEELREQFHLDESMPMQYVRWLGLPWFVTFADKDMGLLQGHLGRSMATGNPVNAMIGDRLLLTVLISLGTILFTWAVAVPTGIYSALRQYSVGDYVFTFLGFIGMCVPSFLLALLLMYVSYEWFGVRVTGLLSPEYAMQPAWDWPKVVDLLQHIWLPVVVLGLSGTAGMIRVMRANLLDELKKPYVVTARAKGVRPMKLLLKYPVRMALNPFISGIGGLFPALVSGGAIVAVVLSLPTVGPLMLDALMTEDMYLAGSMLMVLSLLGVIGTLVSDLLLLVLDPRIRFTGGGR